jgi:circadian clock protein KaiB
MTYRLILFYAGHGPLTERAKSNLQTFCESTITGPYHVEYIDILHEPHQALHYRIMVTPTLLILSSHLEKRLIGDLSDTARLKLEITTV